MLRRNDCLSPERRQRSSLLPAAAAVLVAVAVAFGPAAFGQEKGRLPRLAPIPPAEAERTFRTADGFRMRLLAAEPLVTDPVDLAYDEFGRAYVAEMRGYPIPEPEAERPLGRVRVLRDLDGDGVFDKATVFVDGLHWPTSVAPWKGGVFVLAPPDLWYFRDLDGDDRADTRQKIATGFGTFNVQAVANNLRWGCDGRIYAAGSGNGGTLALANGTTLRLSRADFSFDPISLGFRAETGSGRYGNTFDDFGNRFICNIRNPVIHVVIDRKYLARNPVTALIRGLSDVAPSGDQVPVYPASKPEPWRLLRARMWALDPRAVPRSELVATGFFTSACGVRVYRGNQYGEGARKQVFVCEVAYNLIHRERLERTGVTFKSQRIDPNREVVASTDNWFRPVNLINAPDGTLHVVDMYREVIEHPWSIPDELIEKLDLMSGLDRGRIYRLEPAGFVPPKIQWPGRLNAVDLVPLLEADSSWWSETAQRLLIERRDRRSRPALQGVVRGGRSPRSRMLALWTLHRLGWLDTELLVKAMQDSSPWVRRQAIRVAESYLDEPEVREHVVAAIRDPDPAVRLQAVLSVGELPASADTVQVLVGVSLRDGSDPWFAVAIASSAPSHAGAVVRLLLKHRTEEVRRLQNLITLLLRTAARTEEPNTIASMLERLARLEPPLRLELARALISDMPPAKRRNPALSSPLQSIHQLAVKLLGSSDAEAVRSALSVLASADRYAAVRRYLLAAARRPQREVAVAAILTIGAFSELQAGRDLLGLWHQGPEHLRDTVMLQLMRRTSWRELVLDEIESGRMSPDAVPVLYQHVLTGPQGGKLAARARRLFGATGSRPSRARDAALDAYIARVRSLRGDATRGRRVFLRDCSSCHRLNGEGNQVGPDLSSVRRRTAEEVLLHILDPNREVAPEYVQYLIATKNGQLITGAIEQESGESIRLINQQGERLTVERAQIESITALGVSLMPEGFADRIAPQEMADLLRYLFRATSSAGGHSAGPPQKRKGADPGS